MRFFKVNVVLYASLFDVLISSFVFSFLVLSFKSYNLFEKLILIILFFFIGYCYAISIPTVIDRSLSFYILEKLEQRGGGIRLDKFEDVFVKEYMIEHRLIDVRLTEQLESGTIKIENNCVKLTYKGYLITKFSKFYRKNFLPTRRLLMGEYTDDLVNPFKKSRENLNYICK